MEVFLSQATQNFELNILHLTIGTHARSSGGFVWGFLISWLQIVTCTP